MNSDIHTAKTIALKYLSRAPRSIREVALKLKGKDIGENTIKETINYLLGLGYLNDEVFAKQWAGSKIKSRLWGRNRIIYGLRQKAISDEIIKQTIDSCLTDEAELETAGIALEKWLKKNPSPYPLHTGERERVGGRKTTLAQKAFRHLQAKGFTTSIIISVIKKHLGALEIDEGQ